MLRRAILVFALTLVAAGAARGGGDGRAASGGGWERLPDPPFARSGSVRVWTGRALVVWGGVAPDGSFPPGGALFDAGRRVWRPISPAPLAGRANAAAVWTGALLLVWGGEGRGTRVYGDGAAFDPASGRWSPLPRAPLSARVPAAWGWTHRRLLVWGDASRSRPARDGAAYDPRRRAWSRLPRAPLALNQAGAVWSAGELVVYGARLDGGNASRARYAQGMAYAPERRHWRVIRRFPLSPQASTLTAVGARVVVFDYLLGAGVYDMLADRWRRLPRLPLRERECYPSSATAAGLVVGWYCGSGATLDLQSRQWRLLRPLSQALVLDRPLAAGRDILFLGSLRGSDAPQLWAYRQGG